MPRMTTDRNRERGSAGGALVVLLLLVLLVGAFVFWPGEGVRVDVDNVDETAEEVARDLGEAAETIRNESEDALMTTKVKAALGLSKSVSAFDIDVDSEGGLVTLNGRLPSEESKATAIRIARDVSGVEEVVDGLEVVPDVSPSFDDDANAERVADLELKVKVYEALLRSTETNASRVVVTVDSGNVTLDGSVPTREEVQRSSAIAEAVPGVRTVSNRLLATETTPPSP